MENHIVYLALGSNLGDRPENLRQAIAALPPQLEVKARSHVYETPPWGYADQPKFYNQVIKADTYLQAEPLLKHIKRPEVALGRQASFQNGPRLIDIDLLFFDHLVLKTPILPVPHPRLHERSFVLLPLMDIAPSTAKTARLGDLWLLEQMRRSYQDQLSYPQVLRRMQLRPSPLDGTLWNSRFVSFAGHRSEQ